MNVSQPMLAAATPAVATPAETSREPSDRSEQFVAVTGPESEQVNASTMVVVAYGVFWLLAIAFVYLTYRSQSRLSARLSELELKLSKHTASAKAPAS